MENRIVSNVLETNINFLSRHLILSPTVLEKLKENGVISESIKKQLEFKDTDEQIPFFIKSLNNRGLLTFRKFLAVLKETGHGWMVDVLLSTQALSYEEIASTQPRGQPGSRQNVDLLGERSRLQGMTPEHARMRLTSANLRGRGGGFGAGGGIGSAGLGGRGFDRVGLGADGIDGRGSDRAAMGGRMGGRGIDRTGLGGLGGPGLDGTGVGGMGGRGLGGIFGMDGGMPPGSTSLVQQRDSFGGRLGGLGREHAGGSAKFRGQVLPGMMLQEPLRGQASALPAGDMGGRSGDVTEALLNIHDHFRNQTDTNEQTLSVLKREEMAIRELLEQNSREQIKVRKNQGALGDIERRLEEVNARTNDIYDPIAHSHLTRYRLAQLNQIPWSSDR